METVNRYYLTGEVRFAKEGEFFRGNSDGDHGMVWFGPSKEPVRILRKEIEPKYQKDTKTQT